MCHQNGEATQAGNLPRKDHIIPPLTVQQRQKTSQLQHTNSNNTTASAMKPSRDPSSLLRSSTTVRWLSVSVRGNTEA